MRKRTIYHRLWNRRAIKELRDVYVDRKIRDNLHISTSNITDELRNWYRLKIKLLRLKNKYKNNMINTNITDSKSNSILINIDDLSTYQDYDNALNIINKKILKSKDEETIAILIKKSEQLRKTINSKIMIHQLAINLSKLPKTKITKILKGENK